MSTNDANGIRGGQGGGVVYDYARLTDLSAQAELSRMGVMVNRENFFSAPDGAGGGGAGGTGERSLPSPAIYQGSQRRGYWRNGGDTAKRF